MFRGVLQRLGLASNRVHVGKDAAGNIYYTLPQKNPGRGAAVTERRMVLPASGDEFDFDQATVPRLWSAWLSGGRATPPSEAEIAAEDARLDHMEAKVQEIAEKEAAAEGPTAKNLGGGDAMYTNHASVREFSKPSASHKPGTGAGGAFKPGQWSPGQPKQT